MPPSLKNSGIIDRWQTLIQTASGKGDTLYELTKANLKAARVPEISWKTAPVKTSLLKGWAGKKREFIHVTNINLLDYTVYIGAWDYGNDLNVCRFTASFRARRGLTPEQIAGRLDVFDQLDLSAYLSVVHTALLNAVSQIMEELEQDFSKIDTQSKGFLQVW